MTIKEMTTEINRRRVARGMKAITSEAVRKTVIRKLIEGYHYPERLGSPFNVNEKGFEYLCIYYDIFE